MTTLKFTKWDGGSIGRPGLYENMTLESYHSRDVCDGVSISSSGLRKISRSPAHYWVGFHTTRIASSRRRRAKW